MSKELKKILSGIDCQVLGDSDLTVENIVFDSRQAKAGDLFVALKGTAHDGHNYIPQVLEQGVQCVMCETVLEGNAGATWVQVADSHEALGNLASNYYDVPSANFKLVGITGTNGKTSIATLLYRLFTELGYKSGLISTVENRVGSRMVKATHTTPDSLSINKLMSEMVREGCDYVFMEVSSHAIDQKRIAGLQFDGGVFTNITHDHLDYHKTFDAYIKAKKQFFDSLSSSAFALANQDDKHSGVMLQNTSAVKRTYSLRHFSDFKGKVMESHFDGTLMQVDGKELWTKLIGHFNASNILSVYATAILLGQEPDEVLQYISNLGTVDGRFEYVRSDTGITAVVDYAHTPDALKNVIETINQINEGAGQLITVVGAGGNRDKEKRPEMAKIASKGSNKVILTSDNPRDEEPQAIIEDMLQGVEPHYKSKVLSIADRKEAIKTACMLAAPGDVVLVAGKGHETYQEIKGVRTHFSDKEVLTDIFMSNQIKTN